MKKFGLNKVNYIVAVVIDIILFFLYSACLSYLKDPNPQWYVSINMLSNILIVGISVISSSLITVPLIELKSKNSMFYEITMKDVFSCPKFYESLSESERKEILFALEKNLYFGNCEIKENMYKSIRDGLYSYGKKEDGKIYLEKCSYRIKCEVCNGYFKKTVLKSCELYSYEKLQQKRFPLCATASPKCEQDEYSMIESLKINGKDYEVKNVVDTKVEDIKYDPFSRKSGYDRNITHYYTGTLTLRPDKATKIEICYHTFVPLSDTFYSCRTPYPCHKFSLTYELAGKEASDYSLAVCAFGFTDDAKASANRHDDAPEIAVNFDNWIFPLDGVAVTMKEKNR